MSLKLFSVFVTPQTKPDIRYVLHKLGLGYLKEKALKGDESLLGYPNGLQVCKHQDTLVFKNLELPFVFFSPTITAKEQKFIDLFPNSEITSIYLASGQNYAYSVIQNGTKIRCKSNQRDSTDIGEYLPEELILQKASMFSDEELQGVILHETPEKIEKYKQDELGYRVALALSTRYCELGKFLKNWSSFV
jgi:hypothetical protein